MLTTQEGCALRKNEEEVTLSPRHSHSLEMAGPGGVLHSAHAQAREANLHGGSLEFMDADRHPAEGTEVELMNLVSGQTAKARISAIRRSSTGALLAVTVELLPPTKRLGLTFQ